MKLEVGKYYRRRDGVVVSITEYFNKADVYKYKSSAGNLYKQDGRWNVKFEESDLDLIEEVENEEVDSKTLKEEMYEAEEKIAIAIQEQRLLDQFAGQAMSDLMKGLPFTDIEGHRSNITRLAYDLADDMMAERKRRKGKL